MQIKKAMPFLWLLTLTLTGCAAAPSGIGTYRQVTMQEAISMMQQEITCIILDVRTPEEYAAGHIPGAVLLPNETIGAQPPALLPDKNQLILIYCRSGNRSKQAAEKLARLGYTNIVEFGGINDWPGDIVTD